MMLLSPCPTNQPHSPGAGLGGVCPPRPPSFSPLSCFFRTVCEPRGSVRALPPIRRRGLPPPPPPPRRPPANAVPTIHGWLGTADLGPEARDSRAAHSAEQVGTALTDAGRRDSRPPP